jgi:hypothetical protein
MDKKLGTETLQAKMHGKLFQAFVTREDIVSFVNQSKK